MCIKNKRIEAIVVQGTFAIQYLPLISQNISITTESSKIYTDKINDKKAFITRDLNTNEEQIVIVVNQKIPKLIIIHSKNLNEKEAKKAAKEISIKF
ncbi:hypothetical protein [Caminibacter pacificus]